jgi:hypothetical protein
VTSVEYDTVEEEYVRQWSEATRGHAGRTEEELNTPAVMSRLPNMLDDESVLVVETFLQYDPPFNVGIPANEFKTFIFTRPRFAPSGVLWESS